MKLKKVIAFLMTAAMTLGMGAVAFAEETEPAQNPPVVKAEVAAVKKGEKTTVNIVATQDVEFGSYKFVVDFDAGKVNFDAADEANKKKNAIGIYCSAFYAKIPNKVIFNGATIDEEEGNIPAGTLIASFTVTAAKDLEEGEVVAVITMPNGYTDMTIGNPVRSDADPVNAVVVKE